MVVLLHNKSNVGSGIYDARLCGHKIRGKEKKEEEEEREGVRMSLRGGREEREGKHDKRRMGGEAALCGCLPQSLSARSGGQ